MSRPEAHRGKRHANGPVPLADSGAQRKAILNNIPDQAWLKDENSRYVAVNEAYVEACGVPESDILGRLPSEVWPSAIAAQYLATDREVITSGRSRRYEEQRSDRHGRLRCFETIKTPVRDADGAIIGTAGISRDITHHKTIERELREQRARSRELSAYLQSVREQERTRISRELHDELGQNLTALRLGLDWIEAQLAPGPGGVAAKLASLRGLADATVAAMARIASELRPAILDDLGLAAAVEYLVDTASERSNLRISLALGLGAAPLEPETSTAIFRILQEALTNVSRHAEARNVSVSLAEADGEITLDVADDGRGLPPATVSCRTPGLGLLGMQERASMVGGSLTIDSAPGAGTRLALRVPTRPPAGEAAART